MRSNGYGQALYAKRVRLAHRAFYMASGRVLAKGQHLHHVCQTPLCVNPDHLVIVDPAEHGRMHAREKLHGVAKENSEKPHCPKCGTAYVHAHGQRVCRVCARRRAAEQRQKAGYAEHNRTYQRLWAARRRREMQHNPQDHTRTRD
jgi:hypothetical protein